MDIQVVKADITELDVDAIVSPANSGITMGGGLAGLIRARGGESIKEEAQAHVPVPVGSAVITSAGELPCRHVVHAPTMERPAMRVTARNAGLAMGAALRCADESGIKTLAVPGLGTGVGGVSPDDAAAAMARVAKDFFPKSLRKVVLVAYDDALHRAFLRHA